MGCAGAHGPPPVEGSRTPGLGALGYGQFSDGQGGLGTQEARTVMDGVACSAHSTFFPTGCARPQRAASSVNRLVTCSGNWSCGLGKTQGLPGALGSAAGVWECSRGLGVRGSGWGCDRGQGRKSSPEGRRLRLTLQLTGCHQRGPPPALQDRNGPVGSGGQTVRRRLDGDHLQRQPSGQVVRLWGRLQPFLSCVNRAGRLASLCLGSPSVGWSRAPSASEGCERVTSHWLGPSPLSAYL